MIPRPLARLFGPIALVVAGLAPVCAKPGEGEPLDLIRGTEYQVATVAELKSAINDANAAGKPATILIADGVYTLDVNQLQLTCTKLVVRSASGNRDAVVIRGPDEGPNASLGNVFLVSAPDIVISDITIGYCRWHGIQVRGESPYDVSGLTVHNCRLVNCNEQFIKGSSSDADPVGATDGVIENCLFEFTSGWAYQYYTGGIDIHKGVNWVVRDNLFRNIRNPGSGIAEHAVHFWKRCTTQPQNVVVERNWIINCDRGIGFGLGGFATGHDGGTSVIRNNMIYNDGSGPNTDVGIGLESANDVAVHNNTVVIPTYWAPIEYRFADSSNLSFRNNLTDKAIQRRDTAPVATLLNNLESAQADWFVDQDAGDLHLKPGVDQVIDQGAPLGSFTDDMDGDSRPRLDGWDIGADEYDPATADSDSDGMTDGWESDGGGARRGE
jgi:hypothetical protein